MNSPKVHSATSDARSMTVEEPREFERELLYGEFAETIGALLTSTGLTQKALAGRLGLSEARISRLLRGDANTSLRALADLGWALGYRFALTPVELEDRAETPARDDPPVPDWVRELSQIPPRSRD